MFAAEEPGLVFCASEVDEGTAFGEFRKAHGSSGNFTAESKMLFKVTVDEGVHHKGKPVCYVGIAQTQSFADVLALFNRKYAADGKDGAFLLKGGFGVRPAQSAGQVFMKHGYELNFHPRVDLSRLAWSQR